MYFDREQQQQKDQMKTNLRKICVMCFELWVGMLLEWTFCLAAGNNKDGGEGVLAPGQQPGGRCVCAVWC